MENIRLHIKSKVLTSIEKKKPFSTIKKGTKGKYLQDKEK